MIPVGTLALLMLLGVPRAVADTAVMQQPPLAVRADTAAGGRAVLRLGSVLDDTDLQDAVRSGLPLRVNVRVELWRDRFFDNLEGSEVSSSVLLFEPLAQQYVVQSPTGVARRFADYRSARGAMEAEYRMNLAPARPGQYYYTATLELETLSLSDLEELERWLRGELGPAVSGDRSIANAVGEGAKRLLIRLLGLPSRRVEARSERFRLE